MILPELFALLASDLFLGLSLLTCLLEERFPKALPYIYQIAAVMGFGHLSVSKIFLTIFDENMRFWYNLFYLLVCLGNILALNLYLAVSVKEWNLARIWSAAVTFPALLSSIFFVYNYSYLQGAFASFPMMQLILVVSVTFLGVSLGAFYRQKIRDKLLRR